AAQLVQSLQRRRCLEADAPIDRTRHCRQCSGAHPHYFDVCPHCRSIQIERAMALHCFTCGHVAPQADFQQESALVCPQCHARLRHIGVDYDRPLVQYACADCHHVFIETSVLTRCLDCDAVAAPDALDVRVVAPLRLAARARAMLRQNLQDDLDSDPLTSGYV
ncbi:GGDEF domain-containing protein, partial [Salmonella enterica subsp. enterica]|nr:GGDEF domain-containing protein [Salmonella enterica subsp. enterica serovar Cerro]